MRALSSQASRVRHQVRRALHATRHAHANSQLQTNSQEHTAHAHVHTHKQEGRQAGRQADADAPNMVVRLPAGGTIILFRLRGECRTARAINALHVMLCRGLLTNAAIKEHKNDHRRHPCTKSISPACCQQGERLLPLPFRAPFIAPVRCQHTHDEVGGDD